MQEPQQPLKKLAPLKPLKPLKPLIALNSGNSSQNDISSIQSSPRSALISQQQSPGPTYVTESPISQQSKSLSNISSPIQPHSNLDNLKIQSPKVQNTQSLDNNNSNNNDSPNLLNKSFVSNEPLSPTQLSDKSLASSPTSIQQSPVSSISNTLNTSNKINDIVNDNNDLEIQKLIEQNNALRSENLSLQQKLEAIKSMAVERFKKEVENTKREKSSHEETKNTLSILNEEFNLVRNQLQNLESNKNNEINSLINELNQVKIAHKRDIEDLESLRLHLQETDNEYMIDSNNQKEILEEYTRTIEALESEKDTWESACAKERENNVILQEQIQSLHDRIAEMKIELDEVCKERDEHLDACQSLEHVLAEHELIKRQDIENSVLEYKLQLEEYQKEINNKDEIISDYENQLSNSKTDESELKLLKEKIIEKDMIIGRIRQDALQNHQHLTEALKRLHSNSEQVDKALITNLLISFLQLQRGDPKRFEILQIISNVLKLDEEDRIKIGISRASNPQYHQQLQDTGVVGAARKLSGFLPLPRNNNNNNNDSLNQNSNRKEGSSSFSDMWISFLLNESKPGENSNVDSNIDVKGQSNPEFLLEQQQLQSEYLQEQQLPHEQQEQQLPVISNQQEQQ